MLTLCIDTAYKYLTLALIEDEKVLCSYSEECFKRQSEQVFVELEKLCNDNNINIRKIDSICISKGPGSYTGVRIAMTIAKTLTHINNMDLYTISTLRLYAANNSKTMVLMDARAKRAYVGIYDKETQISEDRVMELDSIDPLDYEIVMDGELIGREHKNVNIPKAFLDTKTNWEKVDNIAYLTPNYLKESDAYYR